MSLVDSGKMAIKVEHVRLKKSNNNHDVAEIVVKDCSTKIMTRIIEYLFSGILKAKDLHLLDFLELKDQVQKILPGDELEGMIVKYLEGCTLHKIRIEETPTIYTDYYGPIDE